MKALIIGAAGFVGGYLAEELLKYKYDVHLTCLANENVEIENCTSHKLDILAKNDVLDIFNSVAPDVIFHLAAQSSVAYSWENPTLTVNVNINGTLNVLDALRMSKISDSKIILIGSGEEYGHIREGACPISEDEVLHPGNIYAATKACQSMIGEIYSKAYNMNIIRVRAFNHVGPRQLPQFVVSDFCKQVSDIEKGIQKPEISVGNLCAKRDFTDVRDVVRAYRLLAENGIPSKLYNIGSGKAIFIQDILDQIIQLSTIDIKVNVDQSRLRPVDVPIIEADISQITKDTGWTPSISITQTVQDCLNYWRNLN